MVQENVVVKQLIEERARLDNSVHHLQQSITALKEAIEEEGDTDREYKKAIEENIVVIARYNARIEGLDLVIEELQRGVQDLGRSVAVPVVDAAGTTQGKTKNVVNDVEMADALGNGNDDQKPDSILGNAERNTPATGQEIAACFCDL